MVVSVKGEKPAQVENILGVCKWHSMGYNYLSCRSFHYTFRSRKSSLGNFALQEEVNPPPCTKDNIRSVQGCHLCHWHTAGFRLLQRREDSSSHNTRHNVVTLHPPTLLLLASQEESESKRASLLYNSGSFFHVQQPSPPFSSHKTKQRHLLCVPCFP